MGMPQLDPISTKSYFFSCQTLYVTNYFRKYKTLVKILELILAGNGGENKETNLRGVEN